MKSEEMKAELEDVIVERRYLLGGEFQREVVVRIGRPEQDGRDARCRIQVIGLADDSIQEITGVDSLQALSLAFVAVRRQVKETMQVLCHFHDDVDLTGKFGDWKSSLPYFVFFFNDSQLERIEDFMEALMAERPEPSTDDERAEHSTEDQ